MMSTITATQKFNAMHSIIRVNATELFVYRLRRMKDLETFIYEVPAVLDNNSLLKSVQNGNNRAVFISVCQINRQT